MKPKKLKKRIQQLEKRLQEGTQKLARLRRRLQEAESAQALKAARKSAARATASTDKKSPAQTTETNKPSSAKKAKRKLNLSPERRAQLAAAMKARWAAKRATEGNSTTSSHQNSPASATHPPENRVDGF